MNAKPDGSQDRNNLKSTSRESATSQEEERGDLLSVIPRGKKVTSDDKVFFKNSPFSCCTSRIGTFGFVFFSLPGTELRDLHT